MADGSSSSGLARARRGACARLAPTRGRGWLAEISNAVVSVFFPSGCRICERVLTSASRVPICEECLSSFERVVCEVCGLPLPGWTQKVGERLLFPACQDRTCAFDRARTFAVYEDAVVRAERLAQVVKMDRLAADVVVPAPLHRERERERGYNQAALLPLVEKAPTAAQSGAADAHAVAAG